MSVGVINIKTQPHSPENYAALFKKIFERNLKAKIHGNSWGTFGTLHEFVRNEKMVLHGTIYRYLNIDPAADWFDALERKPISPEEDGVKPPVPEHLKPHLKYISYLFLTREHRIFFDLSEITPNLMMTFLNGMFYNKKIRKHFGDVDVSIESSKEAIQRILSIPRLTKLEIKYSRPNADDLSSLEERVLARFDSQNIRRLDQVATTTDKEGIKPDEETKALLNVARSNGSVIGHGYAGDEKVILSTEEHPLTDSIDYDPDFEDKLNLMLTISIGLMNKIKNR